MKKKPLILILVAAVCAVLACVLFLFPLLGNSGDDAPDSAENTALSGGAVPFTVEADGQALTDISATTLDTFVQDGTMATENVTLYTVSVPAGTESVDFTSFEAGNVLAYNYSPEGTWLAGYYEDYMTGAKTVSCPVDADGDGTADYIAVQSPYDADWNTTLLCLVTFAS